MIVGTYTIVYPRAVTALISGRQSLQHRHSLVMLCHTSTAIFTVLAAQGSPQQARCAEILLIKLPETQELVNDRLLLASTSQLRDESRILKHR